MEKAMRALHSDAVQNCPRWLLAKAHEATSATGAATAIVAILEKETGILHIANLGDCGLRVVREGKVIFATSPQQHYFDCPYQLSSEPEAQTSKDATVYEVQLQSRDVIIMASDGLFDNVFDKDIENTVNLLWGSGDEFPQRLASALASLASKHSRDPKYESPYSQEAILQGYDLPLWRKLLGQKRTGGKLDDITVLTAYVITDQAHSLDSPIESEVSSRSVEELDPYPIPIWASQS
ncbi:hypothetical protein KP509_1Z173900 [Ceratopteris richardii]|nr:hypothetical protein KP509_1Z173900 [Ceratopteris richardii]